MSPDYVYPEEEADDQDWRDQDADSRRGDVDMLATSSEDKLCAIVCWRNEKTGKSGQGSPVDRDTANQWVEYLNHHHPEIHHWSISVHLKERT